MHRGALLTRFALMALVVGLAVQVVSPNTAAARSPMPDPAPSVGKMPVVTLEGTHYERGFRHGQLLHYKIVDIVDNYILPQTNRFLFSTILALAGHVIRIDPWVEQEAKGIVDGATKALSAPFRSEKLSKTFTWRDMAVISAYVDYAAIGCSSISIWGERSANSPATAKGFIGRNLDWDLSHALLRNQVLFLHLPKESDEVPFISLGFAGLIGCLSCVNSQGNAVFIHTGPRGTGGSFPPKEAVVPITLALREAIQKPSPQSPDPLAEVVRRIASLPRMGSFLVHLFVPGSEKTPKRYEPATVLELQPGRWAARTSKDAKELKGQAVAGTNHHRKLEKPEPCRRYAGIEEALSAAKEITPFNMRTILKQVRRDDNMQAMVLVPQTRELWLKSAWPCADKSDESCIIWDENTINLDDLFAGKIR